MTLKWTRTVSPALKAGTSRSWRRSRLSMIVLIGRSARGRSGMIAAPCSGSRTPPLVNRQTIRGPVGREDLADQVAAGHGSPLSGVARLRAVVAHHEVVAGRDLHGPELLARAPVRLEVRLPQLLAVDEDVPEALLQAHLDGVAGQPDEPLDERAAGAALHPRSIRRVEDDDLSAAGVAQVVDEPIREYAVGEARLAAGCGTRAVERRLHRGGRNAVRVDDVRLDEEHDRDRADDRHRPVD